ncbi:mucin-5AC-like isoform X2 [Lytechinus variegatus]|nr:mucin-5AC-like isoform X2 [Lytechinus variegatus]XP_041483771.1 mucin-5AC-like isoform X2 [Lytechinus variegatus]XP_041483772.1 mucin-5AC-like isoform X2 [Lytechinus variegatus]
MSTSGGGSCHADFLKVLCRLCGERIRHNRGWAYLRYKNILAKLGLDPACEDPDIHPEFVCLGCHLRLFYKKGKAAKTYGEITWERHSDDGACQTCKKGESAQRSGRPKKKIRTGRPRLDPKVAEERRKNRIRIPLPSPTVMTTRSRQKAQKIAVKASTSTAPGLNFQKVGCPKLRKLAPKGAQEVPNTRTSTAVFPVHAADSLPGIQETYFSLAQNTTLTSGGIETPMAFPLQNLQNSSCLTLQGAQPLSVNPLIQTIGPSLAPASYLIPSPSGLQGLSCTVLTQNPFTTLSGVHQVQNPMGLPLLQTPNVIPIIQSIQPSLFNPLLQATGLVPNLFPLVHPAGPLGIVPAVQPSLNLPVLPIDTTETSEGISSTTGTTTVPCSIAQPLDTSTNDLDDELSDGIAASPNPNHSTPCSIVEPLETSANILDDELSKDILANPSPSPSSIAGPSEALPNTEVDQEPQELPRFVLPSTLDKTICIDAFQKHDAGIKCKNCQKMIPLVHVDQHKFKCVPPSLALGDHNYMFSEEKDEKKRKARELRKRLLSKDKTPKVEEAEPVYDLVLIKRSLLEKLEDVINGK